MSKNLDAFVAERNGAPDRTVSVTWRGVEIHRDKFDTDVAWKLEKCVESALGVLNEKRGRLPDDEELARWNPTDGGIVDEAKYLKELIRRRADEADEAAINQGQGQSATFQPDTYDDVELLTTELPEPIWAIPGKLPIGVAILAASPKIGKTWLMLGVAFSIRTGGRALGKIQIPEPGHVLYLALEDNRRRMKDRMRQLTSADVAMPKTEFRIRWAHAWPRLDEGGIEALDAWLTANPNTRLVVIDTLKKVRPRKKRNNGNAYDEDYEAVEPLVEVAERHSVAIVIVHHTRKAKADDVLDEVSGSHGLSGAADTIWVLQRARGKASAILHITGRDVVEQELALDWDKACCQWVLLGDAEDHVGNELRLLIIKVLKAAGGPMTPVQVAQAAGRTEKRDKDAIKQAMRRLADKGTIGIGARGQYFMDSVTNVTLSPNGQEMPENKEFFEGCAGDIDGDNLDMSFP